MKRQIKTGSIMFFLAFFMLYTMVSVHANNRETVKVAFFPTEHFWEIDANGVESGYGADYLYRLAGYANWDITYVHYDSMDAALQGVQNGESDLFMLGTQGAAGDGWQYSEKSVLSGYNAILTKDSNDAVVYEDFEKISSFTLGMVNGFEGEEDLKQWMTANGVTSAVQYFETNSALEQALEKGTVDAVVTNIIYAPQETKIIAKFTASDIYAMTTKGKEGIMKAFDDAREKVFVESPNFASDLYEEYFSEDVVTPFSKAELDYTASSPTLNVGCAVDRFPVCYIDKESNEISGIGPSIIRRIGEISGLTLNLVALPEGEISYDYLRENKIELVSGVEYTGYVKSASGMSTTEPYLFTNKSVVCRNNFDYDAENVRVATATGSAAEKERLTLMFPKGELVDFKDTEGCLNAVKTGKADVMVDNEYVVSAYLRGPRYSTLTTLSGLGETYGECLSVIVFQDGKGVSNPLLEDGRLTAIINKTITLIPQSQINSYISEASMGEAYRYNLIDMISQNPMVSILIVTLLLAVIFGGFFMYYRSNRERQEKLIIAEKNDQLQMAMEQAEQANLAKSQFLAQMSHEIRTPMNAIVGITTICKNYLKDPDRVSGYLDKITSSSRMLLNLINDVLDMSAIENNKLKIANTPFDFKELLTGIASIYYGQCRDKKIKFDLTMTDVTEESLVGDALRINQILLNLLSNAVKFTPAGGEIKLRVIQTNKDEQHVYFRFVVSDTGEGIGEELLPRLFKPFEQESADTAKKHGGSGLGLSITKNLIEIMHGSISVESVKGQGTTFTVNLPFGRCKDESLMVSESFKKIRALIVDDDRDTREYTSVVLDRLNITHESADSGKSALEKIKRAVSNGEAFDICFIDWKMPEMDGVAVTSAIREAYDENTVIIIVSAFDLSEVEEKAKIAGANYFVSKPMFQSTVFNVLNELLGGYLPEGSGSGEDYDFTGYRVLLAEDNELNREIAVELLEMTGLVVDCAENGKIAVEKFEAAEAGTYGMILMDVQMPEMDGNEAARTIRRLEREDAKTIPIFAMTANAFTEDVVAVLANGMNGHIAKPIDTAILYGTLKQHLKEKK